MSARFYFVFFCSMMFYCNCCTNRIRWNVLKQPGLSLSRYVISKQGIVPGKYLSKNRDSGTFNSVPVSVSINVSRSQHIIDERFLSVTLDPSLIREGWKNMDFNSDKLLTLARGLNPLLLRVGGTDADFMIFNNTVENATEISENDTRYLRKELRSNFTMSVVDWDKINKFASNAGWDVLFDLNMLLRNGTEWDSTNAEELLKYTNEKGYRIVGWEMGSESNHIDHHTNFTMDPGQLGKDFVQLRRVLDAYGYEESFLVGPDVSQPRLDKLGQKSLQFLESFLQTCGNSTTATTWHSYSFNGRFASINNYTDPSYMDLFKRQIDAIQSAVDKYRPFLPLTWIGETSAGWGGGTPGLSDAYAGGFIWLDKLGSGAANGVDLIMRQSFYSGSYGLVNGKLNPRPAYWLSYIYKQLVGQIVLSVNLTSTTDSSNVGNFTSYIRAYAHCTNKTSRLKSSYDSGYVTLFMLNLNQTENVTFSLRGALYDKPVDQYLLTPHGDNITAKSINLNGKRLKLTSNETIPAIKGRPLPPGKPITLPSLTYGFFVIDANATACL